MLVKMKFIMSGIWDFLRPLIAILLSQIGPLLIEAATAAVEAAQATGLSGAEKKEMATKAVQDVLMKKGFEVGKAIIGAVIDTAVLKMREDAK